MASALPFPKTIADAFTFSWTIMTWVVVIGSTVVMLLWIVIYSFFPSPDFIDEVSVLFGTVSFWAAVLLSATICLGMRILYSLSLSKNSSTSFSAPLPHTVHIDSLLSPRQGHRPGDVGSRRSQRSTWRRAPETQKTAQNRR